MENDPRTEDLGFARVDVDRARRTGDAEVVYGEGKTPGQVIAILRTLHEQHPDRAVLATRLSEEALAQVATSLPEANVDAVARAATLGPVPGAARHRGGGLGRDVRRAGRGRGGADHPGARRRPST